VQVTLNCGCEMVLRQARQGIAGAPRSGDVKDRRWERFWLQGKDDDTVCYWTNGNDRNSCGYNKKQTFRTSDAGETPSTSPPCHERRLPPSTPSSGR
jgi:hypothetical protein